MAFKYLIERKDTNEWYCMNITGYYGSSYNGDTFGQFPDPKKDWSKNANDAYPFKSKKEAEDFIKGQEFLHDILPSDCCITEHEFVDSTKL